MNNIISYQKFERYTKKQIKKKFIKSITDQRLDKLNKSQLYNRYLKIYQPIEDVKKVDQDIKKVDEDIKKIYTIKTGEQFEKDWKIKKAKTFVFDVNKLSNIRLYNLIIFEDFQSLTKITIQLFLLGEISNENIKKLSYEQLYKIYYNKYNQHKYASYYLQKRLRAKIKGGGVRRLVNGVFYN